MDVCSGAVVDKSDLGDIPELPFHRPPDLPKSRHRAALFKRVVDGGFGVSPEEYSRSSLQPKRRLLQVVRVGEAADRVVEEVGCGRDDSSRVGVQILRVPETVELILSKIIDPLPFGLAMRTRSAGVIVPHYVCSNPGKHGLTSYKFRAARSTLPLCFLNSGANPHLLGKRWFERFKSHIAVLKRGEIVGLLFLQGPPVEAGRTTEASAHSQSVPMGDYAADGRFVIR